MKEKKKYFFQVVKVVTTTRKLLSKTFAFHDYYTLMYGLVVRALDGTQKAFKSSYKIIIRLLKKYLNSYIIKK